MFGLRSERRNSYDENLCIWAVKQFFDGDFGIVGSDSYLTGWFS